MIIYLPPLLFGCVGWFLDDPVSLFSSFVLILLSLLALSRIKKISGKLNLVEILLIVLCTWYAVLAVIHQQFYGTALIGGYSRNFGIASIFAMFLIALIIRQEFSEMSAEKFISKSLISLMVLMNMYGLIQYMGIDPLPWNNDSRIIQLTLGNSNFAGALFGMMTAVPILVIKKNKNILVKLLYILLFISNAFLGLNTETLQFKLLFIVASVATLFGLVLNEKNKVSRVIQNFIILGSLSLVTIFTLGLTNQFASNFVKNVLLQGSAAQRVEFWKIGFKIWETNPVLGVGIANFQNFAGQFRSPTQIFLEGANVVPDRAHNVFIDHFAEGGLLAGIIWLVIVILISTSLVKVLFGTTVKEEKLKYSIFGSIWVTYVVQSLISPDHILLMTIGFISAAFILSKQKTISEKSGEFRGKPVSEKLEIHRYISVFLMFTVILVYGKSMLVNNELRDIFRKDSVTQAEITKAINGWEFNAITEDIGTRVLAGGKQTCGLVNDISGRLLEINPRSAAAWYLQANCSNLELNFDKAVDEVNMSLKFDPNNSIFLVAKAKLMIAGNRLDEAGTVVKEIEQKYPKIDDLATLKQSLNVVPRS